ncbi:hypothetical protein ABVT39_016067 [Epinephelus coioides]
MGHDDDARARRLKTSMQRFTLGMLLCSIIQWLLLQSCGERSSVTDEHPKCAQISENSHAAVCAGFVCISRNITSARRHTESGHEVTERRELLSNSAGGVIYPSCSVVESEASPVVSLTLYVWLRLSECTSSCMSFRPL